MRHLLPISGKDSLCTAIVQLQRDDTLPYEFIFCDVRMELPETYTWLDKVEQTLGISIKRIGRSLEEVIAEQNMLPSHQARFCTKYGKIFPLRDLLGANETATQYVGIRADEDRPNAGMIDNRVTLKFPLREAGIDLPAVWKILDSRKMLPPTFFWQRLYDAVCDLMSDCSLRFIQSLQPWHKFALFSWRSRSNCFMCFYQRLYEWVGLLEHHPGLFEKAEQLEMDYGSSPERDRPFYWRQEGPLSLLRDRAGSIFRKHVQKIRDAILKMRHSIDHDEIDMLSLTSCGIYCGK